MLDPTPPTSDSKGKKKFNLALSMTLIIEKEGVLAKIFSQRAEVFFFRNWILERGKNQHV